MSHWTEVEVKAGTDTFSFVTGNRDLAEDLGIALHGSREYKGSEAISFLTQNLSWQLRVSDHHREMSMRVTHPEREQFSQEVINLMNSCCSFDEKAKTYDKMSIEWPLSVRIFHAG